MTKRHAATVIEYNAISNRTLSMYEKDIGGLIEIFKMNPNRIPENVVNEALSFNMVS
jgi:hypothetical protein